MINAVFNICEQMLSVLLGIFLEVKMEDCIVTQCFNFFSNCQAIFQNKCAILHLL